MCFGKKKKKSTWLTMLLELVPPTKTINLTCVSKSTDFFLLQKFFGSVEGDAEVRITE